MGVPRRLIKLTLGAMINDIVPEVGSRQGKFAGWTSGAPKNSNMTLCYWSLLPAFLRTLRNGAVYVLVELTAFVRIVLSLYRKQNGSISLN